MSSYTEAVCGVKQLKVKLTFRHFIFVALKNRSRDLCNFSLFYFLAFASYIILQIKLVLFSLIIIQIAVGRKFYLKHDLYLKIIYIVQYLLQLMDCHASISAS